jgi:hypothetical protein
VVRFWRDLGMEVVTVDPDRHDEIVAHISHLPQVLASTLCAFLATKDPAWRLYAGGGLRDTTRIAGGDPVMWRAILEHNREEILRALRQYQDELQAFRTHRPARARQGLSRPLPAAALRRRPARPAPPVAPCNFWYGPWPEFQWCPRGNVTYYVSFRIGEFVGRRPGSDAVGWRRRP